MKRTVSLFTYPVMDMKAAEAALNRKAAAGWRLERLRLGVLAEFVPAHVPVRYCLDWCDNVKDMERSDYLELLAQAGWEQKLELRYWNLYEAPAEVTPIQTDGEVEYQRFRAKVLGRMARMAAWSVPLCLLSMLNVLLKLLGGPMMALLLYASISHMMGAFLALLPLWGLGGLIWLGRMALRLWQWKRAAEEGAPTPVPAAWSGRLGELLALAGWLSVLVLLAALAWDVISGCLSILMVLVLVAAGAVWRVRAALGDRQGAALRRWAGAVFLTAALAFGGRLILGQWAEGTRLAPPMEEGRLFPGVTEVMVYHRTGSTSLLSCTDWDEIGPNFQGPLRTPGSPLGDRFDTGTRCTVWRARWPWLAEAVTALLRGGMEPAAGWDGLWHGESGKGTVWLACRGDLVLRAATDLPLEGDRPEGLTALLEQEGET